MTNSPIQNQHLIKVFVSGLWEETRAPIEKQHQHKHANSPWKVDHESSLRQHES